MQNKIRLIKGDITGLKVDAIVNAANSSLLGGGGVDGAIHRSGGSQILEECTRIGGCPTGEAVITSGGKLSAKYVIHTVGPVWHGGNRNEQQLLANCYSNSLKLAAGKRIHTIAFPNISTGIYRFPKELAAKIALETVNEFLSDNNSIKEIIFVCFDDENYNIYKNLIENLASY
ncbi:MAG TPA: O-acetyl-ADP-ribose deacetylase [Lentisphaeria bacterium]|nr:MAG: O-acetyl-ADP-ribose deacetylase [Lentisphaerae bacterium GWF2_38_69]HBM16761.1 O-acetyl-ADP-ribose deacetylase [Lentisphaeria bacterium]